MINNSVKLVIWDLDDTFWRGTLSEEGISPIAGNIETVVSLSKRGIINSICSKNDRDQAKAKLTEMGVYEYFVFPAISFSPKGKAVAEIIENAALRAENVLFLDDNRMNLEEVKFFNPGIMACHPEEIDAAGGLLAHPRLAGKPDADMVRLKQYQFLQRKVEDKSTTTLSNEEFLRASRIRVSIDPDVDAHFDRIVELINRSNQLNYTKIRLNTPEDVAAFRALLGEFRIHAGTIHAVDAYGDYGLIGFYLLRNRSGVKSLIHFVFSCRTMHMGIEQHVYELLGRPRIDIVEPVSYGLDQHAAVDWINVPSGDEGGAGGQDHRKLVLLGGCDLLQLASYCSSNRVEFVNKVERRSKVRYDDPGFVLSSREATESCEALRKIPCWSHDDAVKFDEAVASSELILVSMWPAIKGTYFRTRSGVLLHFSLSVLKQLKRRYRAWFRDDVEKVDLTAAERLKLIAESFDSIAQRNGGRGMIFILGCNTRGEHDDEGHDLRLTFNDACRSYVARASSQFHYVDIDAIVPTETLVDRGHFSRSGYFTLARHILSIADGASAPQELDAA